MEFGASLTECVTANENQFPCCVRCREEIVSGHAYELGDDRWHTHCFSCYRCEKPLTCDSDFLVLGTGTLICFECSDSCRSCGKKIDDLAIILSSSNEAYCSDCFRCCKCGSKIKDLKYAKTRKGLFCISCHERLLAKRKYYEKKRRLKKDLPELPPELITPPSVPEKSPRRPHSDPPRSAETNNESLISQYLDGPDLKGQKENRNSLGVKNSRAGTEESLISEKENADDNPSENHHRRQISIDDVLNSTLEEPDSLGLRNNSKTSLSKTPLRNNSSSELLNRSPIQFRHGMVVDDGDSEVDDDAQDMGRDTNGTKRKLLYDDIDELADDDEKTPLENKGLALSLPSSKKDEETLTLHDANRDNSTSGSKFSSPEPSKHSPNRYTPTMKSSPEPSKHSPNRYTPTVKSSPQFSSKPSSASPSVKHGHSPRQLANSSSVSVSSASTQAILSLQGSSAGGNNSAPNMMNNEEKIKNNSNRLGKSLTIKSKSLVNNLKSRTTGMLDSKPITLSPPSKEKLGPSAFPSSSQSNHSISDGVTKENDTYTGWGVNNGKNASSKSPPTHRTTPKGKSDSNVLPEMVSPTINHQRSSSGQEDSDHRRTRSHASASSSVATNVSMYRTPPLDNNSAVFGRAGTSSGRSHQRNTSWQAANGIVKEEESNTFTEQEISNNGGSDNAHFLRKELAESELALRKTKLELRELGSKRSHLISEVDHLKITKDRLTRDIEGLKSEKERYILESLSQLQQQVHREQLRPSHHQNSHSIQLEHQQQQQQQQQAAPSVSQNSHTPSGNKQHDTSIDEIQPARQADAVSVSRAISKPRFWKIFSGGRQIPVHTPQHQHHSSQSVGSSFTGSPPFNTSESNNSSKLEISNPVLQNPREFSDIKLMPITNSDSEKSRPSSSPKSDGSILYGSTLVSRCLYEKNNIPMIITVCVQYIESKENYMKTEGIYRKSGSQLLIEEIEKGFAECYSKPSSELLKLMDEDIHAVASVLKRYLRKLPNPVLTFEIYEPLIRLVRDNRLLNNVPLKNGGNSDKSSQYVNALETFIKILKNLPREHYYLLRFLSQHISKITSYSESNLMNLYNLSLVFAPGLIRDYSGEKDILDMKERNYVVGFLLGNHKDIFD